MSLHAVHTETLSIRGSGVPSLIIDQAFEFFKLYTPCPLCFSHYF